MWNQTTASHRQSVSGRRHSHHSLLLVSTRRLRLTFFVTRGVILMSPKSPLNFLWKSRVFSNKLSLEGILCSTKTKALKQVRSRLSAFCIKKISSKLSIFHRKSQYDLHACDFPGWKIHYLHQVANYRNLPQFFPYCSFKCNSWLMKFTLPHLF